MRVHRWLHTITRHTSSPLIAFLVMGGVTPISKLSWRRHRRSQMPRRIKNAQRTPRSLIQNFKSVSVLRVREASLRASSIAEASTSASIGVISRLHSLTLRHRKIVHFAYAGSRRNAQRRRSESAAGRGRRRRARAFWPDGGLASPHRRLTGERPMGDEDFRARRVRALLHAGKDVRRA